MFTRNISLSDKIVPVWGYSTAAPAANTLVTAAASQIIDTQGYQSVTLVCLTEKAPAANTPILSAGSSVLGSGTTFVAIANTSCAPTLNTTCQILELVRPSKRYIVPLVTGGTAATAGQSNTVVMAILSGKQPPVVDVNPSNGTFNTTTGVFSGVANVASTSNSPTSILLVANP